MVITAIGKGKQAEVKIGNHKNAFIFPTKLSKYRMKYVQYTGQNEKECTFKFPASHHGHHKFTGKGVRFRIRSIVKITRYKKIGTKEGHQEELYRPLEKVQENR